MPSLEVHFLDGSTEEWALAEATDLGELVKTLTRSTSRRSTVSLGVPHADGSAADFGFVGIAMEQVAWWHVKGMFDPSVGASLWQELKQIEGQG
jgi:hypothetical protein